MVSAPNAPNYVPLDNVRSCTFCHIFHNDRIVSERDTFGDAAGDCALGNVFDIRNIRRVSLRYVYVGDELN